MFSEKTNAWLAERKLAGARYERVLHAAGDVTLTGAEVAKLFPYPTRVAVVIDGNLAVDGLLMIDDMHALVVVGGGDVACRSFWIGEGRLRAGRLEVAESCTFACHASDMERFEVDDVSASILCTRTGDSPPSVRVVAKHVIATSRLEEEKLFSWILDDDFAAVLAALDAGERVDDAWCRAHRHLVTNAEHRAHLEAAAVPPRVRKLIESIAEGAVVRDTEVGGRPAILVVYADGSKRTLVLTPEERAAFVAKRGDSERGQ